MSTRFPLPQDLSREQLASPGDAVARMIRLESAVERVLVGAVRDFLARIEKLAFDGRASLTLGDAWMSWSQILGAAITSTPAPVAEWLLPIQAESEIPDLAYNAAVATVLTASTDGWSDSELRAQLRLALRPDEPGSALVAAARKYPRHGAPWGDLDKGGMSFMDRMKRDARTAVTGLDGILTSSALRDQGFTRKRWVTRHDAKVRETHREAEGQTVALAESFIVGGHPLMYPGERGAPPSLIINCRCTMVGTRWRKPGLQQGRGLVP